jgi:hypothetical protein
MTSRREFLQTGAAVSAFAMNGLVARSAAATSAVAANAALHRAIYDDRYAECRLFAEAAARQGVASRAIANGDVTDFWYRELDLLWRERPVAIAGSTQFGPLFVLEQLARERGLRVAMRVEHRPRAEGTIAHVISAPGETIRFAEQLRSAGLEWPALMAAVACRCRDDASSLASVTMATPGTKPELTLESDAKRYASVTHYYTPRAVQQGYEVALDGPLYSWVIAAVARA